MMSLGGDNLSGRLFKGSLLLEGFMVRFHVPSLTIDSGDLVEGQGRIAGHQILNARTAIFVCEDLLDQQALNTVMTDAVAQQTCQPCRRGLSKGAKEIIAVDV